MVVRTNDSYHSPRKPIPLNWSTAGADWVGNNGGTEPFSVSGTVDPNDPVLPKQYATGRASIDGTFCVALTAGYTPPITLTAWEWNPSLNSGTGGWLKLGANSDQYNIVYDATFGIGLCKVSENATVLIQSSAAITGSDGGAFTDMTLEPQLLIGYPGVAQEGF